SLIFYAVGPPLITWMVVDPQARAMALTYLPYCAIVPALGVPAWQLDGAFLGATEGRALRTSAVIATAVYVGLDLLLAPRMGNAGVWIAFLLMYVVRALALGAHWPGLLRGVEPAIPNKGP
ncbi:MAG: MATE family efflux transporter, partial [Nannocystaceae bacterium]|nr:MATE family efflux transporter [Nannocystaceae bacterium]